MAMNGTAFLPAQSATRRASLLRIGAAVAITAIALFAAFHWRPSARLQRAFKRLAEAGVSERPIEARLANGFAWAPRRVSRGPRVNKATLITSVGTAATDVLREADSVSSPQAKHSAAVALLVLRDDDAASRMLEQVTAAEPTAAGWSDLAAARYTVAVERNLPVHLVDALVAADQALAADPTLAEARFNRALILQRMGLRDLAAIAWQRYLQADGSSGWATEARERLAALSLRDPRFRDELSRVYDRIATDPAVAADLDRRFPQEVRQWGETEILGRWAEAERHGDTVAAARHLRVAAIFGALAGARHDALLSRAVEAVEKATPEQRRDLVAAHLDFRDAQKKFMSMKPVDAEPLFVRAAAEFERGGSPVAILARYFRANAAFEQKRTEECAAELERLLAILPPEFKSCRAQILWQVTLCRAAQGRYGESLSAVNESMEIFAALGERNHAAILRGMVAWVHELIGDLPTSWRLRLEALPEIGNGNPVLFQATLSSIAQTAIVRQDWHVATSFINLELEAAQRTSNTTFTADALLRRALVSHHLNAAEAGRTDLVAARAATRRIPDEGMQSQVEGRLWWVEGLLAPTASERIRALDEAITFHEKNVRRMDLPALLYERARAHRMQGHSALAARDLESAIAELEAHRRSTPTGDSRWGIFHAAEDIFDEAIDLALRANDEAKAFQYSERARALTLLDALNADRDSSTASIPANTTIIKYAALPSRLVIFTVTRYGLRVTVQRCDRQQLAADVERLQKALAGGEGASDFGPSARALYTKLIEPIEASIPPNQSLVVAPDATLAAVPFAALLSKEGRHLVEDHTIVVAPSVAFYQAAPKPEPAAKPRVLVVVNDKGADGKHLAEAAMEARTITRMYGDGMVLEGERATPAAFEKEAAAADLIHFSGHGMTSHHLPEDTFLALAGSGTGGRLDVKRIAATRLTRRPIVVLAACSTARGRVTPLEGTLSVGRAFLAAGATSVLTTLWDIDDEEAAAFFVRLHMQLMRGESPAEALRAVQVEWIRSGRKPNMWAAVEVNGS